MQIIMFMDGPNVFSHFYLKDKIHIDQLEVVNNQHLAHRALHVRDSCMTKTDMGFYQQENVIK